MRKHLSRKSEVHGHRRTTTSWRQNEGRQLNVGHEAGRGSPWNDLETTRNRDTTGERNVHSRSLKSERFVCQLEEASEAESQRCGYRSLHRLRSVTMPSIALDLASRSKS